MKTNTQSAASKLVEIDLTPRSDAALDKALALCTAKMPAAKQDDSPVVYTRIRQGRFLRVHSNGGIAIVSNASPDKNVHPFGMPVVSTGRDFLRYHDAEIAQGNEVAWLAKHGGKAAGETHTLEADNTDLLDGAPADVLEESAAAKGSTNGKGKASKAEKAAFMKLMQEFMARM